MRRELLAMVLCMTVACVVEPALGDTYDDNGRIIASLHVAQDESRGETDYANLTLFDQTQGDPGSGWLDVTCTNRAFSTRPSTEAGLTVQTPQRRQTGDTASFRIRVDRDAPHRWDAETWKQDFPEREGRPASFGTSGDVPDELARGLIAELAAGKRMIAQIGDLPVVTLNLDAAKADIVEFSNACERMWRDFARSSRSTARIAFEDIDPFTDEGLLQMELFHQMSHDDGPQPWVSVTCRNDEEDHGVEVHFGASSRFQASVREDSKGTIRLRVDSDKVRQLELLETKSDHSFRIGLSPRGGEGVCRRAGNCPDHDHGSVGHPDTAIRRGEGPTGDRGFRREVSNGLGNGR